MNALPLKAIPIPIQGEIEAQKKPKPHGRYSADSPAFSWCVGGDGRGDVRHGQDNQVKSIDVSSRRQVGLCFYYTNR